MPLLEAARRGFAAGVCRRRAAMGGGALGPFAYVMPALVEDARSRGLLQRDLPARRRRAAERRRP